MSTAIGLALLALGLLFLSESWRASQDKVEPGSPGLVGLIMAVAVSADDRQNPSTWYNGHRGAAVPLGLTGGCVALGGLAVIVSGWDTIGKAAAVITLVIVLAGLLATAVVTRRAVASGAEKN
ncbi:MAG: hypothetical protein KDB26_06305 [Microthrixaceae bacterium]|nr:hypothetical protein [Microthrixaceae bacterium]